MKNNFLILVFVLIASFAYGQSQEFMYKRKLEPVGTEGWYSITLPATIFSKVNHDYSDIRVLSVEADTTELPYLIRTMESEYTDEVITLQELNKSKKDGKLFVTFELPKGQSVNYLNLTFEEDNFNGLVTLEGSADQHEWFEIMKDSRILSIRNQQVDFNATTISFPSTNYRFLRASIQTDKPTTFISASFENRLTKEGTFQSVNHQQTVTEHKHEKKTEYTLTLDNYQPVSRIAFNISHAQDYYRSFSIETLTDIVKTDKGLSYYYEPLYSGYLTSLRKNEFEFPTTLTQKLRITIYHADNTPITVSNTALSGPAVNIILPLKPGDTYALFYGNNKLYAPSYDIVHFKDQIPSSFTSLKVLDEETIGEVEKAKSPLIENKVWLWLAMGLAIGLMGYFTLRMMRAKA